ncbi:P-loop NTPase fold protein [Streptomyces phaeochromogenes]|uniref:P-loop NTPase fold protein n=1 Tax=Streptomyces phaeochromogenes TaxID=1923 RepID=UPI002E112FB4|nr:KAP family NTPase [Streptomyces phaeochromogenes]
MLTREEEFAELLTSVLAEPEVTESLGGDAPTVGKLRESAEAQRRYILGQARDAEAAYQEATSLRLEREHSFKLVLATSAVIVLVVLAAGVAGGWDEALKQSLAKDRPVEISTALGAGLTSVVVTLGAGAIASLATWWGWHFLSPGVRARDAEALDRQLQFTVWTGYGFAGLGCAALIGESSQEIAWQLLRDRPLGKTGGYDWGIWVTIGVGLLLLSAAMLLWIFAEDVAGRDLLSRRSGAPGTTGSRNATEQLARQWREAVSQALLSFMRTQISEHVQRRYGTLLSISSAPGLKDVRAGRFHVMTPSDERLATISSGMDSGSIALAGPRGVGKTQLLKTFCADDHIGASEKLSIVVRAPVLYDRREFMLHLFAELCEGVISEHLGATQEQEAANQLRWIHYLQTRSDEAGVSAGWRSWNLSAKRATTLAREPLTYPEIVSRLSQFLRQTASVLSKQHRRLVIGIDELDRIEPAANARTFLNELKAVFDVPQCLFVLSVSDEALRDADLAILGQRDAFDSAIDEVVRVNPLDQITAQKLLDSRVIGLPVPFMALFYCLSGGMPRDLLRTARAAVSLIPREQTRSLGEIANELVDRELDRIANAASGSQDPDELLQLFRADVVAEYGDLSQLGSRILQRAGAVNESARMGTRLANRAYHLDTVLKIFTSGLTREQVSWASDRHAPGSFTALARAQREIGTADTVALSTLQRIREAWSLPALP